LVNLDYANAPAPPLAAPMQRADIWRLESRARAQFAAVSASSNARWHFARQARRVVMIRRVSRSGRHGQGDGLVTDEKAAAIHQSGDGSRSIALRPAALATTDVDAAV
jgi:hypothetical protein